MEHQTADHGRCQPHNHHRIQQGDPQADFPDLFQLPGNLFIRHQAVVIPAIFFNASVGNEILGSIDVLQTVTLNAFHCRSLGIFQGQISSVVQQGIILKNQVFGFSVLFFEVGTGFDALHEEYVDMVKKGILDPAKVTRSALQNATSVAGTLLTTEAVVSTIKEETPAMPAGAPGMGMM